MPRSLLAIGSLVLILASPAAAREPGERIDTPEGWLRVEPPDAPQEGFLGTIEAKPAWKPRPAPERPAALATPPQAAPRPRVETPCHKERARYVEELFRMAGIWDAPWALDLLEALDLPTGSFSPWVRFNLFGQASAGAYPTLLPVDPLRPLAWDQELRYAARQLVACSRAQASSSLANP